MLRTLILIAVLITVKGDECIPRSFGNNSIVCVCNSTYCDTVSKQKLQQNQLLWYTSTQDGKRMQSSIMNFSAKNESEIDLVLTVDINQKFQKIQGFGGAMTDAAALNIKSLSNNTQQILLESYFGSKGIGYTFTRIPIAGTDFSMRPYTYDDVPDDLMLSHFGLVEEDDYKIKYLHNIKKIMSNPDEFRILTTAWSAPAWMKSSKSITWGILKSEYYQLYADYIVKFFDAYKERGINIWGITPGNEPLNGFIPFFTFNSMGWTPNTSAVWTVKHLAPTLTNAGYNPLYIAMDDQRFEIPWFTELMFEYPKTKELFSGTAVHWYADEIFSPIRLSQLHDKYPDKFILMSEACTGSSPFNKEKVILGSWKRGQKYALNIIENLSHWMVGWIDWNMALDEYGAPNWAKNYVDSPIIVMPQTDEFYKQPMFYAISHFSQFVPRNSYRILSTGLEDNPNIKTIAFLTPENCITVVAVNKAYTPSTITIKNKNKNNVVNVCLPAKSFNTLLYLAQE
ncbi:PREDICTED: glucosylceramidase-like [Acromyrmex echinatior]|uniref:glucosylceramidase-like n=1 Tax=Acromyrmex echinatior TaxID=103372 RepID=UPI000580DABD|nr:PREDICTED: glucosylceramidase-like [Acromyrmex echinatior]XP_011064044.1 PREDICTED: glucosylceramidase-like [Acromyrmex echinatior]XP_011064045.1 PREDICTED: glucosylceramidase-like [Acromyrmex echinatior]XP_011064046.1 PREDICTED: glucosylceramidase-like [Acromyrmex echinatior]XP_011064047.1 PREDICTED: glucosylceramidase-like [Acromyrmex echinatior]XP_011064048.1 PREDICTED: glucosylceramidase-like [Acromyrmex echinatior]